MYKTQIACVIGVALILAFILGWHLRDSTVDFALFDTNKETSSEAVVLVSVDTGSGTVEELPPVPYAEGDSVLSILKVLEEAGLVVLSLADVEDSMAAANVAITNLADDPNGPGWHFWVNDTYGMMNPESYPVSPGDHIHLTFTPE